MTRTLFSLAALVLAVFISAPSPASACISCNYTPEVAKTPSASAKPKPKKQVQRSAPAPRKKVVKRSRPVPKSTDTAKATPPADTTPTDANPAEEQTAKPAEEPAAEGSDAVSTATLDGTGSAQPPEEIPQGDSSGAAMDCKRFSPTAGTTVPVPCD